MPSRSASVAASSMWLLEWTSCTGTCPLLVDLSGACGNAARSPECINRRPTLLLQKVCCGSLGILHGDLKGGNILLRSTSTFDDPRGFVCKLGDFGLSRILDSESEGVMTGAYGKSLACFQTRVGRS